MAPTAVPWSLKDFLSLLPFPFQLLPNPTRPLSPSQAHSLRTHSSKPSYFCYLRFAYKPKPQFNSREIKKASWEGEETGGRGQPFCPCLGALRTFTCLLQGQHLGQPEELSAARPRGP